MSLTINTDETIDATFEASYQGLMTVYRGTRIATVHGLTDGSSNQSATALARAMALVQNTYPAYTGYPNYLTAVVQGHRVLGMRESNDDCKVQIYYQTPTWAGGSVFIVSDSTTTANETTQLFRSDINGKIKQLLVKWTDPQNNTAAGAAVGGIAAVAAAVASDPNTGGAAAGGAVTARSKATAITKKSIASIQFDKSLRRVVLDVIFKKQNLSLYRSCVNCVNHATYLDLPRGFWKFNEFNDTTEDLGFSYRVQIGLDADIERDWSRYDVLKDRNLNQVIEVDPAELAKLQKQQYTYDILSGNGCLRVGPYRPVNFASLFGKLPI